MGYDTMNAWDRRTFQFNDHIQNRYVLEPVPALPSVFVTGCLTSHRGGVWNGNITWQSAPGRSISQDDYKPPSPVELPGSMYFETVPSFEQATAKWSPPPSPSVRSRSSTMSPPRSPRADSACHVDSPVMAPLSVKEKERLGDKLYAAVCAGDLDHVRLLISIGAPVNSKTLVKDLYESFKPAKSGHLSPLAGAAGHGQMDIVALLVAHGAILNPNVNQSSSSPLHQACRANDVEIARFLLALGADVDMLNCYRTSPLMYAVKYGSAEMVGTVLQYKPDLHQISFISSAAIHWSIWPGRTENVELLLQAGADKDHPMANGSTPLHCAAIYGHVEIVRLLLRYGADLSRRNDDWKLPIHVAEESGSMEVLAVLKEATLRRATV